MMIAVTEDPDRLRTDGTSFARSDVKELGELLDGGEALLVVGAVTLEDALVNARLKPTKHVTKHVDASAADVDTAVKDADDKFG